MKNDPAIRRVRDARHAISAECGHDPQKLLAYYRKRVQERQKQGQKAPPRQEAEPAAVLR
jgi:hypothetical protein